MTKALFKKQLLEAFSWVYYNQKNGKRRSGGGLIGFLLLYGLLFAFLAVIFYMVANQLCGPLTAVGMGWLYMALMGLMGVMLGVFGSVFSTYSSLYLAKDNDLLLAMPIPPGTMLMARLSGVYAVGLMYELLVMAPAVIAYGIHGNPPVLGMIFAILIPFVLSVFVLTLSCALGWVVALVSSRLKNQKIVTVFLSLAFIAAYYYFYGNAYQILEGILANPAAAGQAVRSALYPLYQMGMAAQGSVSGMLIFTAIVLAIFAVAWVILSRSFLRLATTNRGEKKARYVEKQAKAVKPDRALLTKELRRFTGSAGYMLNCGLGIVMMVLAGVVLLVKQDAVQALLAQVPAQYRDVIALGAAAALCTITCMNDMAAPSVSLEGKSIWLTQVLPVSGWQILRAKLRMHLLLTWIPAAVLTLCLELLLRPTPAFAVLLPATVGLFVLFVAALGLAVNLKLPNLHWTNEMVPLKQGAAVMVALLGGWVLILALGVLYYFIMRWVSPLVYLLCAAGLFLAAAAALLAWLKTKGAKIFETLA